MMKSLGFECGRWFWRTDLSTSPSATVEVTFVGKTRGVLLGLAVLLCLCWTSCSEIISPDITDKEIVLNSPADSLFTSNATVSFWWEKDAEIEQYRLRITSGPSSNLTLEVDTLMVANSITFNMAADLVYHWQVTGENAGSQTVAISRELFVDQTTPEKATALAMDGDTVASTASDTLRWASADFPLSGTTYPVADSLILYRRNDSTSVGARYYFGTSATKELPFTGFTPAPFNGPGTYYWQVLTIDQAGNKNLSDFFRFVIQ